MEVRKKRKEKLQLSIPIKFEGGLQSSVRGDLVNELIKYLLYERQQIPLPLDLVKRDLTQQV